MLLTPQEQKDIRNTIISKTPEQLKMQGFLWTLAKISQHIRETHGKEVSERCLTNYMRRWGLTCQRPTKRACGQDIARVERFKSEEYPAIAKRAKAEGAVIYWGDAIELFFLPPYAPEINPPEYLNHALKQDVHSGDLPRSKKDIKHKTQSYMRRLQHNPERVRAFFRHKNVGYIVARV
jgi:transposase